MKVLLVNKYLYPRAGDAISTITTGELLLSKGHDVIFWGMEHPLNPHYKYEGYFVKNIDYNSKLSILQKIKAAGRILYSFEAKKKIGMLIDKEKPDIAHLNNFAHQISPSILDALKKRGIPAIMTIRDFKLVCPRYDMSLHDSPCEKCKDGRYYNCVVNKCLKGSLSKSILSACEMYLHHGILHIYDSIRCFVATTGFTRSKMTEMGFRGDLEVLNNFIDVSKYEPRYDWEDKTIVYFGRIARTKGLVTLLDAVKEIKGVTLKLIGDGPLKDELAEKIKKENINNVQLLSHRNGEELWREIRNCMFCVIPSEWYELFGRTIMEAAALGKPTIGSRIGGIPELIKHNETGLLFEPHNAVDLRSKIEYLLNDPEKIKEMGRNARIFAQEELGAEKHYRKLMDIYEMALKGKKG